jgi:PAS domain S-box-containing protein
MEKKNKKQLFEEIEELRLRLKEAEETLNAIRGGEVDAIVVSGLQGEQVFTLTGAERAYRVLIETMNEGAASLNQEGLIIYCNQRFSEMIKTPLEKVIGARLRQFIRPSDLPVFDSLMEKGSQEKGKGEVAFINNDGTVLPALLSISALQRDNANICSITVTDLTAQKHIEEELRRHRDHLEKLVKDRTNELGTSNRLLREEIIERKQREELLKEEELKYRELAESISDIFLAMDRDLRYTYWNKSTENVTGILAKDAIGKRFSDIFPDNEVTRELRNFYLNVIKTNKVQHFTSMYPGGKNLIHEISAYPSKGGVSVFIKDITERKKAEEALREASEFNRQIIESAQEGLIVYGLDLKYLVWNPFMERLTGLAADEVLGRHPQEVFPFLRESGVVSGAEKAMKGETIRSEPFPFHVPKSGLSGWTSDISAPLRNARGDVIGVIGTVRDITENVRAEEALKEEKTFIENALNTLKDLFFVFDLEGRFLRWNQTMNVVTGYRDTELALMKAVDFFRNDDIARVSEAIREAIKEGSASVDAILVTKNGRQIPHEFRASQLRDLAGNLIGISGVGRDLTERHKLEAQLRHSQKMEAVGTLAGGVAHDFNNILNVILGYGNMVMDSLEADSPSKENMKEVLIAADRAANLTKTLLVFSRKQVADVKLMDINKLIQGLQKMLLRIIGENIDFTLDLANGQLSVMADFGQIEQVLMNLVTNARDAMMEGGHLTIGTGIQEINDEYVAAYGYGKTGKYALITVADTGQGMDAEIQKKIFEPFFTTKGIGEGTGLGLAISYGIIKQHNGYIKVYSEPGQGTVFKIYLPLVEETAGQDHKAEAPVPVYGGNETILVAEDDASLRKLKTIVLESFGYSVVSAKDGEDAIAKFMENRDKIQLAILDMIMPKKNGKEVSEAIRKVNPLTKILFTSGYTMDIIKTRELAEAGFDFLLKPISSNDLLKKVRDILDK